MVMTVMAGSLIGSYLRLMAGSFKSAAAYTPSAIMAKILGWMQ